MIFDPRTPVTLSLPVTVPVDFCGMQWFGFPSYSTGYSTPFQSRVKYKCTYNNDWSFYGGSPSMWQKVEQTQGVYTWDALDKFVGDNYANGINVCVSMLYMPSFYSANPSQSSDIAGVTAGAGGPLTALGRTGWANFVTAMVTRYKNRGTPIKYFQAWEEPWWPVTLGSGYWWGTAAELVDLAYIGYTAAKAADPSITVLSVSASPPAAYVSEWWNTTGAINTTIRGYNTCDEYGVDFFGYASSNFWQPPFDPVKGTYHDEISQPYDIGKIIAAMRIDMGANQKPITITSLGAMANGSGAFAAYFRAQTPQWRKVWIARLLLQCAALGVQRCIFYGGDSWTTIAGGGSKWFGGDFVNDTDGVIAGFNEIADNVAGKTIIRCGYTGGGKFGVLFSSGLSYEI